MTLHAGRRPPILRKPASDICCSGNCLQGDSLPQGCVLAPNQDAKIILAWGEVTGHHHRIEDHVVRSTPGGEAARNAHAAAASTWRNSDGSLTYKKFTDYAPVAES